jgi:hypothetical protein
LLFRTQVQGRPAGDEHLQAWAVYQQVGHEVCRFQQVLKIIEEQQKLFALEESTHLLRERLINLFTQSQHVCHGLWHKRRITQSCQVKPGEAIGKTSTEGMGKLERQPGLANPAGASQSEQTHTPYL